MKRWLALAIALSACEPPAERVEAERVHIAIRQLRACNTKDIDGLRSRVEQLEFTSAKLKLAMRARDDCAQAYRLLLEARELTLDEAEEVALHGREDGWLGWHRMFGGGRIQLAEEKVAAARVAMPGCDAASTDLSVALSRW